MYEPDEYQICCAIKDFADLYLLPTIHIPNEGKRGVYGGYKQKRIGLLAGVSDYFFPRGNGDYKGLWLEAKTLKGKPTKAQLSFIELVNQEGYYGAIGYGLDACLDVIRAFYDL